MRKPRVPVAAWQKYEAMKRMADPEDTEQNLLGWKTLVKELLERVRELEIQVDWLRKESRG